jgi:hypothetical protein
MQPGNTSDHQQTSHSYLDHLRSSEVNGRSLPQRVVLSFFLPHVHRGPMTWGWWDSRSLLRPPSESPGSRLCLSIHTYAQLARHHIAIMSGLEKALFNLKVRVLAKRKYTRKLTSSSSQRSNLTDRQQRRAKMSRPSARN